MNPYEALITASAKGEMGYFHFPEIYQVPPTDFISGLFPGDQFCFYSSQKREESEYVHGKTRNPRFPWAYHITVGRFKIHHPVYQDGYTIDVSSNDDPRKIILRSQSDFVEYSYGREDLRTFIWVFEDRTVFQDTFDMCRHLVKYWNRTGKIPPHDEVTVYTTGMVADNARFGGGYPYREWKEILLQQKVPFMETDEGIKVFS